MTAQATHNAAVPRVRPVRQGPIAFFLPSAVGGGAERVTINLVQGMTARGLAVDLVLASASGPFLAQVPDGARLVDLRAGRVLKSIVPLAGYLPAAAAPGSRLLDEPCESDRALAARLARQHTPVVVTEHNTRSRGPAGSVRWREVCGPSCSGSLSLGCVRRGGLPGCRG